PYKQAGWLDYDFIGSHKLVNHPLMDQVDLLHLHNLHGGYFNLLSLPALTSVKPVVWTLHDMQALTGHCAYSMSCDLWKSGCGHCPDLQAYPSIQADTTASLWADKQKI